MAMAPSGNKNIVHFTQTIFHIYLNKKKIQLFLYLNRQVQIYAQFEFMFKSSGLFKCHVAFIFYYTFRIHLNTLRTSLSR